MPPAGAHADHAGFAVGLGLGSEEIEAALHVAHHAVIPHHALLPHPAGDLLGPAEAEILVDIGAQHAVAVVGETVAGLPAPFVPARHMGDQHDAGVPSRSQGTGPIAMDSLAVVSLEGDGFGDQAGIRVGLKIIPHGDASFLPNLNEPFVFVYVTG